MADEDFGSAFTGMKPDVAGLTQQWDDFLQRPGNRQALLQIGLNLMQPVGFGQTTGGHIAQAIGAGGEAVDRAANSDLKDRLAEAKLEDADARLGISQQVADATTSRANTAARRLEQAGATKRGGLTDAFRARAARQDAQNFERQLERDARDIVKQANDVLADPNSDVVKQYKGKTAAQIREELRKTRPAPKYGNVPSNDAADDGEDDGTDTTQVPDVPNAKLAPDGNYYVPDPQRPGKYLKVAR